ncbi:tRNA pseudouridine synthase B [Homoserinimonas aerilata]|uniref:tRNA pseudouridine synthase B n=1 Tax=Homoserinimonas aerilata TaxID=1162970 RepID=A0A542YK23_9MICO|nr:tRNA pseudouridine(55) synthase TruB [Homoserinimonas aerilata]TQL48456.1 tRNA pseudouridine synthase B [Homoserinimonas aerilata]
MTADIGERSGILLIDKPQGLTSHDVVSRTRRLAQTRKVGHAGTLDPMATGLLLLGVNSSTRLLTYLVGLDKEYLATIRLGRSTTTDDAEGEAVETVDASAVDRAAVEREIASLTGEIEQVPSTVSAIKVGGRRAYALVRAGEQVELKSRRVTVSEFEIVGPPRRDGGFFDVDVRVVCSSGTYIRALARDVGAALGVGGHLTALRRTRIGPFSVEDAVPLPADRDQPAGFEVEERMLHPASVAGRLFATAQLDAAAVVDLENGKRIPLDGVAASEAPVAALAPDGRLVGLVQYDGVRAKVLVNFPTGA